MPGLVTLNRVSYGLVKACDRDLITLLGKWRQRMKWSDYQSSPLVWLGGSSPPHKIEVVGSPQNNKNRQIIEKNA